MELYKKASKEKIRFTTKKGLLSSEQLWDLSIKDLDEVVVGLEESYQTSGAKTFIPNVKETSKDRTEKLKFEVALDILQTKVKDQEVAAKAQETRRHNNRINELIAQKKEGEMNDLSVEELEKLLR